MNPYETLGVEPDADDETIRKAHRKAAMSNHPDQGGDPEKMLMLNQAVAILRDPEKRRQYDETGRSEFGPDDERARLLKFLNTAFADCLAQLTTPKTTDLIARVKTWFDQKRNTGRQFNANNRKELEHNEEVFRRLSFKGQGTNVVGNLVRENIQGLKVSIASMDEQLADLEKARLMVDDYAYAVDVPPAPPSSWGQETIEEWAKRNRTFGFSSSDIR